MAVLKIGPYLENRCQQSENKFNFDPLGVEGKYISNFLNLGHWPSFMPKYGNCENCISGTADHRGNLKLKISSVSTPWDRKRVYMQLLKLANYGHVGSQAERQGPWASCLTRDHTRVKFQNFTTIHGPNYFNVRKSASLRKKITIIRLHHMLKK